MARTNADPSSNIRTGLTSEYFLAAFLEPGTAYRLGQMVQQKSNPSSKNLYVHTNNLKEKEYLIEKKGRLYPNLRKLAKEISLLDAGTEWTTEEAKLVAGIFEHREFFDILAESIRKEVENQPSKTHRIDSVQLIADKIGMLAATHILFRDNDPGLFDQSDKDKDPAQILQEFQELSTVWNKQEAKDEFSRIERKMQREAKKTSKELDRQKRNARWRLDNYILRLEEKEGLEQIANRKNPNVYMIVESLIIMLKSLPSLKLFYVFPEEFLWKLARLWNGYEQFEIVYKFSEFFNEQKKTRS